MFQGAFSVPVSATFGISHLRTTFLRPRFEAICPGMSFKDRGLDRAKKKRRHGSQRTPGGCLDRCSKTHVTQGHRVQQAGGALCPGQCHTLQDMMQRTQPGTQ